MIAAMKTICDSCLREDVEAPTLCLGVADISDTMISFQKPKIHSPTKCFDLARRLLFVE